MSYLLHRGTLTPTMYHNLPRRGNCATSGWHGRQEHRPARRTPPRRPAPREPAGARLAARLRAARRPLDQLGAASRAEAAGRPERQAMNALEACHRARRAWENSQPQLQIAGVLDEALGRVPAGGFVEPVPVCAPLAPP